MLRRQSASNHQQPPLPLMTVQSTSPLADGNLAFDTKAQASCSRAEELKLSFEAAL